MKYRIAKRNLPKVREYLKEINLELHKDFEIDFELTTIYDGVYILEFLNTQDEIAFFLKFNVIYETSTN